MALCMKKNIAIVSGGDSGEYEVSLNSADVVKRNLDQEKYKVFEIRMKGTDWKYVDGPEEIQLDKNDFSILLNGERITFDCVFIAIHGTPGEDGKLQAYFDMLNIPYTSSGVITSAVTFNKYFCNHIVKSLGVRTAPSVLLGIHDEIPYDQVGSSFSYPVFVKPNKGGSSVGISKVFTENELKEAVDKAFREDDEVLIEKFIEGREITCGVMIINGKVTGLPITEIISNKEFFDYESKYDGIADEITPADIPKYVEINCIEKSEFLYRKLNCKGVVRFDYIFTAQDLYFLEVNIVPGLSEASIVPQQADHFGLKLQDIFSMLIEEALSADTAGN